jgi:hypothetical protein
MRLGVQALASKFSLPNSARIEEDWPRGVLAFNFHAPRTDRAFDFLGFLSVRKMES